jgi:hypothetical protein
VAENPYAPPKAVVEDLAIAEPATERPRGITLVVQLAAAQYLIGLATMAFAWDFYSKLQSVSATVVGQVFTVAITGFLYFKIYQGRNWARITWLIFAVIGLAGIVVTYPMLAGALPTLAKVQGLIGFVFTAAMFWILFVSPAKEWFRHR